MRAPKKITRADRQTDPNTLPSKSIKYDVWGNNTIWAQDYREKHKLGSKQISDSAFGALLSFCKNQRL